MSSLHIGESVPLPYVEGGILSRQRIECLLDTEKRVSLLFLDAEERVSYLHGEVSVLLLFIKVTDSWRDTRGIRSIRSSREIISMRGVGGTKGMRDIGGSSSLYRG